MAPLTNTEDGYEFQDGAQVSIEDGEVTIIFDQAPFARYIKLHATPHDMDEQEDSSSDQVLMEVESSGITIQAMSGGSNEFYTYFS